MNSQPPYFYETEIEWTGERFGELTSPGLPAIEVAPPPEFKGPEGYWTPEHLYIAGVNSCFMATFLAIAELSKLPLLSFACSARGTLEKVEGAGYQITEIVLKPRVVVSNSAEIERAQNLLNKVERNCVISKSIKSRLEIEPAIAFSEGQAESEIKAWELREGCGA